MENNNSQLQDYFEQYISENEKFTAKGNKAAAKRARKALLEIMKLSKVRRAEISEEVKEVGEAVDVIED